MTISDLEPTSPVSGPSELSGSLLRTLLENEPIRAELYGSEHLEAHARQLAAKTGAAIAGRGRPLLRSFATNSRALVRAHGLISQAYKRQESVDPDAEWLLDNFYVITDALREIQTDLPQGYYKLLPKIADAAFGGLPRV